MKTIYHILNGDALKERFPKELPGEILVARECLVDGPVYGKNLQDFYTLRAKFLSDNYGGSLDDYHNQVAREFEAISNIPEGSAIYLWFEDDLFCQVNFWFVAYLLADKKIGSEVFLARPAPHSPYSFGGLSPAELIGVHKDAIKVKDIGKIGALWEHYRHGNLKKMFTASRELESDFPFILDAVQAHMDRIPSEEHPGRPKKALAEIMEELKTKEFGPVFREFCRRESIYGFGDLQVKRLLDELIENQ